MYASVFTAGTLTIPTHPFMKGDSDCSGALVTYQVSSPEQLYKIASRHQYISRKGKLIKASDYSLRMAENDFTK